MWIARSTTPRVASTHATRQASSCCIASALHSCKLGEVIRLSRLSANVRLGIQSNLPTTTSLRPNTDQRPSRSRASSSRLRDWSGRKSHRSRVRRNRPGELLSRWNLPARREPQKTPPTQPRRSSKKRWRPTSWAGPQVPSVEPTSHQRKPDELNCQKSDESGRVELHVVEHLKHLDVFGYSPFITAMIHAASTPDLG